MTVTTTTTTNTYTGDGTTTAFSFTFEILETTDIKVIVVTTATGVESVRSIGTGSTNYAVTGTGNVNGGTVTFVTAPTASETVFLMRNMAFTQPTDYRTNDPFPAETHENALDRMALQIQQVSRRLDRALLRPESDTTSGALPHNIDLKGGVLKFNSSSGVPEADSSLTDVATSSANGLMSSSDKAKLDGIEASATTDQTASEILSAIKTVDGASSGLDADLLDGQQGSYYLDASNFSGLGTVATLNVGIGNNNIPKFTSGVADNDFLKVDGSVIEGRSASEVVSDLGVITADSTTTLTNKTIDASQLSGTIANARLDAQLQDVAGLAVTDGGFIVGDGSNFVLETGATVRTSLGLGTAATLDTGISNTNIPKFTSGVADNDFLKVDGTAIEGRSAAEVLSDIGGITASSTDTLTNKTIDASQLSGTVADARLPASISSDITGNAATATLASTTTVSDSTANTNFPVVFHDESNGLLDDTGALRYNPSTGELLVPKLTVAGTTTTVDTVTMNAANAIIFEGATADAHETTLTITDPTADRTITLPNATGTVLLADGDGSSLTNVNATTLDSLDSTSFLRSDAADTKTSGNLHFSDNVKATFGDTSSPDLEIFHDGNSSLIDDRGTGSLFIRSSQVNIQNNPSESSRENMATFAENGAVTLMHDGAVKFFTTSSGATVTGTLVADGVDLDDNEEIRLGSSQDGAIRHTGSNLQIFETTGGIQITNFANDLDVDIRTDDGSGGTALYFKADGSTGASELYNYGNLKLATTSTGATVTGVLTADGVDVGDNEKLRLGASQDLEIFHDGSNSAIIDQGTGGLFIRGTAINIDDSSSNDYITATEGGAVTLFHNGSARLITTSTGAKVTGGTGDGVLIIEADTDNVNESDTALLQLSQDGGLVNAYIGFDGVNNLFIKGTSTGDIQLLTATGEVLAKGTGNGAFELYHDNSKKLETTSSGATVTGTLQAEANNTSSAGLVSIQQSGTGDASINFALVGTKGYSIGIDNSDSNKFKISSSETIGTNDILEIDTSNNATLNGDLTLTSTDAGATENPTLDLFRNSASPAVNDVIGHITFSGENDASQKTTYAEIETIITDETDGTEDSSVKFNAIRGGSSTTYYQIGFGVNQFHKDVLIESSDAGATENPTLDLYRNSASPADNDVLGHIHFSGENDADQKVIYNEIESRLIDASDGTEDGRLVINTMTGGSLITHYSTGFGFNQFHREVLLASGINLQFEGATSDGVRTTLTVADPTSSRTITLPDASGTVQVTSSSDRRLKKNIEQAQSASQKIDDINVYQFDWIEDGKHEDFGVVAQEMQEVFPDCVAVQDPETGYLGIDYSKLVPVLLKEIKDLRARVADLENKNG